jgi:hypothetical protein
MKPFPTLAWRLFFGHFDQARLPIDNLRIFGLEMNGLGDISRFTLGDRVHA